MKTTIKFFLECVFVFAMMILFLLWPFAIAAL